MVACPRSGGGGGREALLCVALDHSDRRWILDAASSLGAVVDWLKVGLEAFSAHGPALVGEVAALGARVFLDLKLHDIPTTVRRAAAACTAAGAQMLTVHAAGGPAMVEAAAEGVRDGTRERPLVVAVTLLTSLDAHAVAELGFGLPPAELVARLAATACEHGADGVVASALEAPAVRAACGEEALLVTPGIRPSWAANDDQRRVVTPGEAVAAGADLLVVGRPITRAADPVAAARRVLAELRGGA